MTIKKITADELPVLTQLFDYNDIDDMLVQNRRSIENGSIDIFVMFVGERPVGELHAAYESEDERAVKGQRAYLSAFRVHEEYQGRGLGKELMQFVIDRLTEDGYAELTIGVEDDNERAKHMYERFGFTRLIARKYEEYQGDGYEFGLYLRT